MGMVTYFKAGFENKQTLIFIHDMSQFITIKLIYNKPVWLLWLLLSLCADLIQEIW